MCLFKLSNVFIMELKELVSAIAENYELFIRNAEQQVEKGNKSAGSRARKAALELMKLTKEFRKVSNEASKA